MKKVWQIFVPESDKSGTPYLVNHHREWDVKICSLSDGITIMRSIKGKWIEPKGHCSINEKMIPVIIVCDTETIHKIVSLTKEHYGQKTMMAYVISNEVIIE